MSTGLEVADTTVVERSNAELAILLLLVVPLWIAIGPTAVGIWLATAIAWIVLGTPYAVAAGFVGLAATPSYSLAGGTASIAPGAYVLLALGAGLRANRPLPFGLTVVVTTGGLVGACWLLVGAGVDRLWIPGLVVLVLVCLLSYAVYRYERVVLGLVDEPADPDDRSDDDVAPDESPPKRSEPEHPLSHEYN